MDKNNETLDADDRCRPLTLAEFLKRMTTQPDGRRVNSVHYYGDREAVQSLKENTPHYVYVVEHPSIVDS